MADAGRRSGRVGAEWFEDLYGRDPDPWGFATSDYERRKYDLTLACLPRRYYRYGFEPGCSFGVLTRRLASRCERLLASDVVPGVVARAARALEDQAHVTVERRSVPEEWPEGPFDLVVVSELGYYFPLAELEELAGRAAAALEPGGDLVAVHWTGPTDYPSTAGDVHRSLAAREELEQTVCYREARFELGCWRRR